MNPARMLSLGFGLLMVAAVALLADAPGLIAAGVSAAAVLCSVRSAGMSTVAVASAAIGMAVSDGPPVLVGLAGVAAGAYLMLRHAGAAALTRPTMVALLLGSVVGLGATAVPLELPWLPLVAPFAVVAVFVLVVWPVRAR